MRTLLNPARPIFSERRYLLSEEPDVRDRGLYHSVLAAIAGGSTTRGAIAGRLGRSSQEVAHPLGVLEDAGLVAKRADAFSERRPTRHVTEPIVAFYHVVQRPRWDLLQQPGSLYAASAWAHSQSLYSSLLPGPHFEMLVRTAAPTLLASHLRAPVARVQAGVVNDPAQRRSHQLDLVAFSLGKPGSAANVVAIGETKLRQVDTRDLHRLVRLRTLVALRHPVDPDCLLVLASASGFSPELRPLAQRRQVVLVGLEDLYTRPAPR